MLKRIKQFIAAITASISPSDRTFLTQYLNTGEQELFWRMSLPDQRHALNVAYTVLKLAKNEQPAVERILVKSALLHDIGKIQGDISVADKVITVLAGIVFPHISRKWGQYGRGGRLANLRHAFYVYYYHPVRGAEMAEKAGVEPLIVELIRKHHKAPTDDDPPELLLLQQADNMN